MNTTRFALLGSFALAIASVASAQVILEPTDPWQRAKSDGVPRASVVAAEPATITVSGRGSASSAPDRAQVSLGVSSQKVTAAEAQTDVNAALNRSLEALGALNIPKKSITTASINLYPIYDSPRPGRDGQDEPPRVVAYRASNTIRITLDDLTLIGKVIDACIKSGCNQLEGVVFELKDDSSQRRDALASACVDAAAKAETIASALKLRLVGILEIVEGGAQSPPMPMYRARGGIELKMDASSTTSIEPGQVKVDAEVTIRYEVEPLRPS